MIERVKTGALIILVVISLVQSYILAYITPKFEQVTQTYYVQTDPKGTQSELVDVIMPDQIILHMGKNSHTVLRSNDAFYNMIMSQLIKKRTFEGFRRTTNSTTSLNWEQIRNEQKGIEVRFKEGIPIQVLKSLVQIKEDMPIDNDVITRIWMYNTAGKDEVKTYFFTDLGGAMYEAVKADITALDIQNKVDLGSYLPNYKSDNGDYYLPDTDLLAIRIKQPYTLVSADEWKRSLFVNPELTRLLMEKDGTQTYTDAKRGLQIQTERQWLMYTDPISTVDSKVDTKENFLAALQFINQHGGWNGSYTYVKGNTRSFFNLPQTFTFRQYIEGIPVINLRNEQYGYMKLSMQKGTVSSYERSLIVHDATKTLIKTESILPGGNELKNLIDNYRLRMQVVSVFPAYRAVIMNQVIDYVPVWAVELRDGTFDILNP